MVTKVVYATGYSSFGLSDKAVALWKQRTGRECLGFGIDIPRDDPDLAYVVETLEAAACKHGVLNLKIRALMEGTRYVIRDYDAGGESVVTENEFDWRVA
jgi:hypothetical protein